MRYRAPLLDPETGALSNDHYRVLTSHQLSRFAQWSIQTGRPVLDLMDGFMLEEIPGENNVMMEGTLPTSQMWGAILPDGSTHT